MNYVEAAKQYVEDYAERNHYFKLTRIYWPKKMDSGVWVMPFTKVWKHVIPLPGGWRKPIVCWFTEQEYTMLKLKGDTGLP